MEVTSVPNGLAIPTAVMAALCIYFGIFASFPLEIAQKAASMLLGGS